MKGSISSNNEKEKVISYIQGIDIKANYNWEFTRVREKKTLSQVSYCWLVFTHVAQEIGDTKNDMYLLCLEKFPVFKEVKFNNEIHLVRISMSDFSKEQMIEFIDNLTVFFRTEGFDIPDPDDLRALDMYNYYKGKNLI